MWRTPQALSLRAQSVWKRKGAKQAIYLCPSRRPWIRALKGFGCRHLTADTLLCALEKVADVHGDQKLALLDVSCLLVDVVLEQSSPNRLWPMLDASKLVRLALASSPLDVAYMIYILQVMSTLCRLLG